MSHSLKFSLFSHINYLSQKWQHFIVSFLFNFSLLVVFLSVSNLVTVITTFLMRHTHAIYIQKALAALVIFSQQHNNSSQDLS